MAERETPDLSPAIQGNIPPMAAILPGARSEPAAHGSRRDPWDFGCCLLLCLLSKNF